MNDQIRMFIAERLSISSHHVAKLAGIDKSSMSRFMNGGRLSTNNLEKLIKLFGIMVSFDETWLDKKPVKKGRPKKPVV